MALTDDNNMVMPVAPMYGGNGGGFGGGFGGDWGWIILLLLLAGGGWGNGFGGGFGGGNALGYDFPWILNGQNGINANTNNGFQNAMLNDNVTSIRDGISALSTQLCNCCADMAQTVNSGFSSAEIAANSRQMASMNQIYGLSSQIAQTGSDNRLATANLAALVQSENCADREALSNGIRDLIANQTAGTQRILDQLCADKIDAKNDTISQLRQELLYARGQASQIEQTAAIRAGQNATMNNLVNELRSCPIPAQPVYGSQPIFTCPNNNNGCGCGCSGF